MRGSRSPARPPAGPERSRARAGLSHRVVGARSNFRERRIGYGIDPGVPHEILWDFEKFLVDRGGNVVARFAPDVTPESELVSKAIERAL